MTLSERIDQLTKRHGSLRAAARVTGIDPGYLHRLREGNKTEPGPKTLRRLGLRVKQKLVVYERTRGDIHD